MLDNKYLYSFNTYLFDLDNTIYDENIYLFEGYKKIALRIESITSVDHISIWEDIKLHFFKFGREGLFNSLIAKYNLKESSLDDFLKIQRTLRLGFKMELFPGIEKLLFRLQECKKNVLIVTNGNPSQQRNKINQINWKGLEPSVIFVLADEIVKKPSALLFQCIKKKYKIEESETLMIGDSDVDMKFANNSKIKFLNVSEMI